jgi:hypothetical protein
MTKLNQPKKLSNKRLTEQIGYLQINDKLILDFLSAYIEWKGDKEEFAKFIESKKPTEQ